MLNDAGKMTGVYVATLPSTHGPITRDLRHSRILKNAPREQSCRLFLKNVLDQRVSLHHPVDRLTQTSPKAVDVKGEDDEERRKEGDRQSRRNHGSCIQKERQMGGEKVEERQGCSSVAKASDCQAAEAGLIPPCGKGFFSHSTLSAQTLLWCPYIPCVQSHALTSVCTLKIPRTGSRTFSWTRKYCMHCQGWVEVR